MQNNPVRQRVNNSVSIAQPKTHERERISRNIKYPEFVTGYAFRQAWYGFVIGACAVAGILVGRGVWLFIYVPFKPVLITSILIGGLFGGVAGMYSLHTKSKQYSVHMTEWERTDFETETPQAPPAARDTMIYNGEPIDKTRQDVMVDGFRFDGVNLDELHRRYLRGIVKVKRDSSDGVDDGFNTLPIPYTTSTYHTVKTVLEKNGFIENSKWTPRGVEFIKGE